MDEFRSKGDNEIAINKLNFRTFSLRRSENRLLHSFCCVSVEWERSSGMGDAINVKSV